MTAKTLPHSHESESATLGSMILDPRAVAAVARILTADDYFQPKHGIIHDAIVSLNAGGDAVDMVKLVAYLEDKGLHDRVGGTDYLIELFESVPTSEGAAAYAQVVADRALRRRTIDALHAAEEAAYKGSGGASEGLDSAVGSLMSLRPSVAALSGPLSGFIQDSTLPDPESLDTGIRPLDAILGGWEPGSFNIVAARPSQGKASRLPEPVLTPQGWSTMGALRVGDEVVGSDGRPCVVEGVFPQGTLPIFRVELDDGGHTVCCNEHLWFTQTRNERRAGIRGSVKTLGQIRDTLARPDGGSRNHAIPTVAPVEFAEASPLPMDPYLLGVWLGDGHGSCISNPEPWVRAEVEARLHHGDCLSDGDGVTYRINGGGRGRIARTIQPLRDMGLYGLRSWEKTIPTPYLTASPADRLQVLQGLCDADGSAAGTNVEYSSASRSLAECAREIAWSLGLRCRMSKKAASYTYKGERLRGRTAFRLLIEYRPDMPCVRNPKHVARLHQSSRNPGRKIVSITPAGEDECVCIAVSASDNLYVTKDYIVTHNTALAIALASHYGREGIPAGFISAEMAGKKIGRRFVCQEAGLNMGRVRAGNISPAERESGMVAQRSVQSWPLWLDETPGITLAQLQAQARQWKIDHDIKVLFVDYLQLMSHKYESDFEGVTANTRGLKHLGRELGVVVVCLAQINREGAQGGPPRTSQLKGSGECEQAADSITMIHKTERCTQLIVGKNRDGETGVAEVHFDGGTGRFNEVDTHF